MSAALQSRGDSGAIASYLDIPMIAFQEKGVKQQDGLLGFLQGNCTTFTDRHLLSNIVADTVQQRGWKPNWKNQLELDRDPSEHSEAVRLPEREAARFFHVEVRNLHPRKPAVNCYVYLEKLRNVGTGVEVPIRTVESKWEGYILPNAVIAPGSSRRFDAFYVHHNDHQRLRFSLFTDAGAFLPQVAGVGDYELGFAVISENFPQIRRRFRLHIGGTLDSITLAACAEPKDTNQNS